MKLVEFKHLKGYFFILTFENGETKETDLTSLLAKHVDETNLSTAQLNKDWGCLEFNGGAVDIEPKTLYRYVLKSAYSTYNAYCFTRINNNYSRLQKNGNTTVKKGKSHEIREV